MFLFVISHRSCRSTGVQYTGDKEKSLIPNTGWKKSFNCWSKYNNCPHHDVVYHLDSNSTHRENTTVQLKKKPISSIIMDECRDTEHRVTYWLEQEVEHRWNPSGNHRRETNWEEQVERLIDRTGGWRTGGLEGGAHDCRGVRKIIQLKT